MWFVNDKTFAMLCDDKHKTNFSNNYAYTYIRTYMHACAYMFMCVFEVEWKERMID